MHIVLAVIIILLVMIVHEAGHALAMNAKGVEIQEFGLGIPFPYTPYYKFSIGKYNFVISLLLVGAYVRPSEAGKEKLMQLSKKERCFIYGAGPLANLILASVLGFIFFILYDGISVKLLIPMAMIVLWIFRKPFCQYLLPIVGLIIAILTAYRVTLAPRIYGPIGAIGVLADFMKNITGIILITALLTLFLGLLNMLPIFIFYGGKIVDIWLDKKFPKFQSAHRKWGVLISFALIFGVFIFDLVKI